MTVRRRLPIVDASATRTHCPYCALQCGIVLERDRIDGDPTFPTNAGALCVKGFHAAATLAHPERLRAPLVRNARGKLVPTTWDDALDRAADRLRRTREAKGAASVGVFGSGALTNEKAYLLGKLARVGIGTPNIDYNGRFCMASAAAAAIRAFGIDRGLPFPLSDVAETDLVVLVGSNVAETMPPVAAMIERRCAEGGRLVVVDPRRSATAARATAHLALVPGTDAALANGLLHVLVRRGWIDRAFIERRTEGWEAVRASVAAFWPERVEAITGVPAPEIERVAAMLADARSAVILTGRGPEQQTRGVDNAQAFVNLALALGLVGRERSGWGTITGQGNGQGGREHGQKADQLPGYRRLDDPAAREHVARVWGVDPRELPAPGLSAAELLAALGRPDGIAALFVMGANVRLSAPRALDVDDGLRRLDALVVCDFFLSETAEIADVVLPSAHFAEEDGTMTNLEGRVVRRRRAIAPPDGVSTDLEILVALGRRLGDPSRFPSADPRVVFDELRRASAGGVADYAGISYERIDRENGVFWPCPSEDHPGTPRLFGDGFPTPSGRARFVVVTGFGAGEGARDAYPLHLLTGRVLAQYQTGTLTRRVAELARAEPAPFVEIHPSLASDFGIDEGDAVTIGTRRATATFFARVTRSAREDTLFVPMHFPGDGAANRLTDAALDPISKMPAFKVSAARIVRVAKRGERTRGGGTS